MLILALIATADAGVLDTIDAVAPFREQRLAGGAPAIPREAYEKAAKGSRQAGLEYPPGVKAGKGWGVAISDLPVERLWMAVNGVEEQDDHFDGVDVSQVIRGDIRGTDRDLFQMAPIPLATDRWWVVHQQHNGPMFSASGGRLWEQASKSLDSPTVPAELTAAADAGMPIAWAESAWLLIPLDDGRTVIEYYTWNDPGGYIPTSLASRFAPGAIKRYLADLEAYGVILDGRPTAGFVKPDQTPL